MLQRTMPIPTDAASGFHCGLNVQGAQLHSRALGIASADSTLQIIILLQWLGMPAGVMGLTINDVDLRSLAAPDFACKLMNLQKLEA